MGQLTIPGETGAVSDGFHTFAELYQHRNTLFVALMLTQKRLSWKSHCHHDGTMYPDYFIAGMHLPTGDITYHFSLDWWDQVTVAEYPKAPLWDGHTPADVMQRLLDWVKGY